MDILGPGRGKMTIYGSDFQQENLTPNGGVSPTVNNTCTQKFLNNSKSQGYDSLTKLFLINALK